MQLFLLPWIKLASRILLLIGFLTFLVRRSGAELFDGTAVGLGEFLVER